MPVRKALFACILVVVAACATYTSRMQLSRDLYYGARYEESLRSLDRVLGDAKERDRSLLLVERGKVNLAAGRWDAAIADLQEAERRFLEIEGTMSLSESAKSILLNPTMGEYQPDAHEKIVLSAYLCLAYWMKGDRTGAFVERNRLVERLDRYLGDIPEKDRAAFEVPFARYLAAVVYEAEGRRDDARIEYEALARTDPDLAPPVIDPRASEIVVFAENGRAPVRESAEIRGYLQRDGGALLGYFYLPGLSEPQMFSMVGYADLDLSRAGVLFTFAFPTLSPQPRAAAGCRLVVDGVEAGEMKLLDDLEATAKAVYGRELPGTLFKAAVRTYLKTVAQTKLADNDDRAVAVTANVLGKLFAAADRADTRSWQTLPAEIRVFRMETDEENPEIAVRWVNGHGVTVAETKAFAPPATGGAKRIVFVPGMY